MSAVRSVRGRAGTSYRRLPWRPVMKLGDLGLRASPQFQPSAGVTSVT
jgi:hypothetical protein